MEVQSPSRTRCCIAVTLAGAAAIGVVVGVGVGVGVGVPHGAARHILSAYVLVEFKGTAKTVPWPYVPPSVVMP